MDRQHGHHSKQVHEKGSRIYTCTCTQAQSALLVHSPSSYGKSQAECAATKVTLLTELPGQVQQGCLMQHCSCHRSARCGQTMIRAAVGQALTQRALELVSLASCLSCSGMIVIRRGCRNCLSGPCRSTTMLCGMSVGHQRQNRYLYMKARVTRLRASTIRLLFAHFGESTPFTIVSSASFDWSTAVLEA